MTQEQRVYIYKKLELALGAESRASKDEIISELQQYILVDCCEEDDEIKDMKDLGIL